MLKSPDEKLKAEIVVSANTLFRLYHRNQILMHSKPIGMTIGKKNKIGFKEYEPVATRSSEDRVVEPVVANRYKSIKEKFNQLTLEFKSGLTVEFRCYDDGFAYRMLTSFESEIEILTESMGFDLTTDPSCWFPKDNSFFSSNERKFVETSNQELKPNAKASLPVLWQWKNGPFLLFTETDLHDYPEVYLKTNGEGGYQAIFPKYPASTFKLFDRLEPVVFTKKSIAKTDGTRSYPWRVFCVADDEKELLATQLPYLLATETELENTDWIKPGQGGLGTGGMHLNWKGLILSRD